jgi:hypothetical protein
MHSFAPFSNLNFFVKNRQFFCDWINENSLIQSQKNRILHFFLRIFDEFFSGFRAKFQKIVTCVAFSIKFAKTNQKFAENSEFCEKNSLLFKIIHFTPYPRLLLRRSGPRAKRNLEGKPSSNPWSNPDSTEFSSFGKKQCGTTQRLLCASYGNLDRTFYAKCSTKIVLSSVNCADCLS